MEILIITISIAGLFLALFQVIIPFVKKEIRFHSRFPFLARVDSRSQVEDDVQKTSNKGFDELEGSTETLVFRLLSYIWNYPLGGGVQESWAAKESEVLRGNLENAKRRPGLGVAIHSTELALNVFGEASYPRIDICIAWWMGQTQREPPWLITVERLDPITSQQQIIPDFRHTLAFAIVLARSGRGQHLLTDYVDVALNTQKEDGAWEPGKGVTISEIFTAVYAIELLALCSEIGALTPDIKKKATGARDRAIEWLIGKTNENLLWDSGVLTSYAWDPLFATAWVIRRLVPFTKILSRKWFRCAIQAVDGMVRQALNEETWKGTENFQRLRVEARIAAACAIAAESLDLSGNLTDAVDLYLSRWKQRTQHSLFSLPDEELDLSTALFLADVFITDVNLLDVAEWVLGSS